MKLLVFILFIFISGFAFAQEASQEKFKLKSSYKKEIKDLRRPLTTVFSINYEKDTAVNRYLNLSPQMSFKHSSTMYDMTKIILFKNGTFFCYAYNCLRDGSSAGNYTIRGDTLMLTSTNKVFKKLKKNPPLKEKSVGFVELRDLKFLLKQEQLISIK